MVNKLIIKYYNIILDIFDDNFIKLSFKSYEIT